MKRTKCVSCSRELKPERRSDMRFCGGACRVRAYRLRRLNEAKKEEAASDAKIPAGLAGAAATTLAAETLREQLTTLNAHQAQDLAALEQERMISAALRTQLAQQCGYFAAEIGRLCAEWQAERAQQLRQMDQAAEEVKLLTDRHRENAELLPHHRREIESLQSALAATADQSQRLLQARSDQGELLDNEIRHSDRLTKENAALRRQVEGLAEQAKLLSAREQSCRGDLVASDQAYTSLHGRYHLLAEQHKGLLASSGNSAERWRCEYNEMVANRNRLLRTSRERYQALWRQHTDLAEGYQAVLSEYDALRCRYNGQIAAYKVLANQYHELQQTGHAAYSALQLKYNSIESQYSRLLGDPAYHQFSWSEERCRIEAEKARLLSEKNQLVERLAEASAAIADLQAITIDQRRKLEFVEREGGIIAGCKEHKPARRKTIKGHRGDAHKLPRTAGVPHSLKDPEQSPSLWKNIAPLLKGAATGVAGVLAVGSLIASGRNELPRLESGQGTIKRLKGTP